MEKFAPSEEQTHPSEDTVLNSLRETLDMYNRLKLEKEKLNAENIAQGFQIQFETQKRNDLVQEFKSTRETLETNANQLSSLYLNILNTQHQLTSDNIKLSRDIDIVNSLSSKISSHLSSINTEVSEEDRLWKTLNNFLDNIKEQISKQNQEEGKLIEASIFQNNMNNQTFTEKLIDLLHAQNDNFRQKLEAVMGMSESFITQLNNKSADNTESSTLGKRESFQNKPTNFEVEILTSKNQKLVSENKFLLYTIECFQKKFIENKVNLPPNFLSTEFLLKNKTFLVQSDSPLFMNINELYERNLFLEAELRKYQQSSYLSSNNPTVRQPKTIEELKTEFKIIGNKAQIDQGHELKIISTQLSEFVKQQNKEILALQKSLTELQSQKNESFIEIQVLKQKIEHLETQCVQCQEAMQKKNENEETIKKLIQEKLEIESLRPVKEMDSIRQFMDSVVENTSLLFSVINDMRTSAYKEIDNQPSYVDQLFNRLNEENKSLRIELSSVIEQNKNLNQEKSKLLDNILNLEIELKNSNKQDLITNLETQLEDSKNLIDHLTRESEDIKNNLNSQIENIRITYEGRLNEMIKQREDMQHSFNNQINQIDITNRQLIADLTQKYETDIVSLNNLIQNKDFINAEMSQKIKDIQIEAEKTKTDISHKLTEEILSLKDKVSSLQEELSSIKIQREQDENKELINLKSQIQFQQEESRNRLSIVANDYESKMITFNIRIKELEHTLEVVQFNRDNLLAILEHSFGEKATFDSIESLPVANGDIKNGEPIRKLFG